jgi:DNA-binding NtrC family response regulator
MARVVAFVPDLLFGSRVQGALRTAGYDVELVADERGVREAVARADVLVVDLTDEAPRRMAVVEAIADESSLVDVRTLAFYAHVEVDTRVLAKQAGFGMVVPRSRMAREAGALVDALLAA